MSQKSAFEAIPGKDALVEYESKVYPKKSYVERNGLIYKSVDETSNTFLLSEWELVGDLREVRVPDIAGRNTLTGATGTSYGVHLPILDNTNVLVLDASADPAVGVPQFARYNYNESTTSWLLLQIGTGAASASTSVQYSSILNRPFILSGLTINTGAGLIGGGSAFGSIPAAGGIINIDHADTSSQTSLTPTGRSYIQQLKFDTFGHVTGASTSTWTHPSTSSQTPVLNTNRTYIQSINMDANGHITSIGSSAWTHPDTSSQASSNNTGNVFIQSITLDGDGHVTGINTGTASGGGGSTLPAGSNGQIQYNAGGAFGANADFTMDVASRTLTAWDLNLGNINSVGARSIYGRGAGVVNLNLYSKGSNSVINLNDSLTVSVTGNSVFSTPTAIMTLQQPTNATVGLKVSTTTTEILFAGLASSLSLSPNMLFSLPANNTGQGGVMTFTAGNSTSSNGGYIRHTAGSSTSSNGGNVELVAGSSQSLQGGSVSITSGDVPAGTSYRGSKSLFGGASTTKGGDIELRSGYGASYTNGGGLIRIRGLSLTNAPGAGIDILACDANPVTSYGGTINIIASKGNVAAGDVNVTAGNDGAGNLIAGVIRINGGVASTVTNAKGGDIIIKGGGTSTGQFNSGQAGGNVYLTGGNGGVGATNNARGGHVMIAGGFGFNSSFATDGGVSFFFQNPTQMTTAGVSKSILIGEANGVPAAGTLPSGTIAIYNGINSFKIQTSTTLVSLGLGTQGNGYSTTSVTTTKTINPPTITLPQLANVVGTLINDLITMGILKP